jgi:hypothetical protein
MFKILSTYSCLKKCNIWRVAARPSYIQDARFLKVNDAASSLDCIAWNDGVVERICCGKFGNVILALF